MTWNEYTVTMSDEDHKRLVIALGAALRETRKASEVATGNGHVNDAREHVFTALAHLTDVAAVLGSKPR